MTQADLFFRFCTRCGCVYERTASRCPDCQNPEYSLAPTVTTEGWLRRQKANDE